MRAVGSQVDAAGVSLQGRHLRRWSSQLRGPLAAAHALVEALLQSGPATPVQVDLAGRACRRLEEMARQLDEMCLLAELADAPPQAMAPVDVSGVVERLVADAAGRAARQGVQIACRAESGLRVTAWAGAVEKAVGELLDNALKYTPAGGSVSVEVRRDGKAVVVQLADSGIGVPAEQRRELFSEFFRAANARQVAGGTGLGLAVVRAVARSLGGEASLECRPQGGVLARLKLPGIS